MTRRLFVLLLTLLLVAPEARAADDEGGILSGPTAAARSVGSAIAGVWQDVVGAVGGSSPVDHLPSQMTEDDKRFFAVLENLGLQLAEVSVGKGWMGGVGYRFVALREPSDVDLNRAELRLTEYEAVAHGFRARAKQKIARATLDTVSSGGFTIAGMEVVLWPWPDASYKIAARTRPLEPSGTKK